MGVYVETPLVEFKTPNGQDSVFINPQHVRCVMKIAYSERLTEDFAKIYFDDPVKGIPVLGSPLDVARRLGQVKLVDE